MLQQREGLRAAALPHPHSNLDVFNSTSTSRVDFRMLGLIISRCAVVAILGSRSDRCADSPPLAIKDKPQHPALCACQ